MIGKQISHYRIIEELGRGGMGEVYLAHDTELDREVALKFLSRQFTQDEEAKKRFKREAKAAAALNHPNIITVHEIGEYEGPAKETAGKQLYIAMEYVKGHTLRDWITSEPHEINDIVEIAAQICNGLKKAHESGIVHRDLMPENILIDTDGRVRIVDFGLAKLKSASRLTSVSSTLGTLYYMSPEQLQGSDVDHRADIWSLGIIFYEMLTQKNPFESEYEAALVYAVLNETPEQVSKYREGASDEIQNIVDLCLEKDNESRYQQIEEVLEELSAIQSDVSLPRKRRIHKRLGGRPKIKKSILYHLRAQHPRAFHRL